MFGVSNASPGVGVNWGTLSAWESKTVWDRLGSVLFCLAVRVRFFGPLGLLLGPSWGAAGPFGAVLGSLGPVFGCGRHVRAFNFS